MRCVGGSGGTGVVVCAVMVAGGVCGVRTCGTRLGELYVSRPAIRMADPRTNWGPREGASPRYGSGKVKA